MFEPQIMCFLCKWCTSSAADLAGTSRLHYAPNNINMRVMCSSRVDPQHILYAFKEGADGVFLGGCHPGDCHYVEGNYKALRRVQMLRRILQGMGIQDDRFRLEWISASEGEKVKLVINDMAEKVRALGPLGLPQRFREWDQEMESLQHAVEAELEEVGTHAR
jgi:F420-non-reducing hydrogenase iron-sulfur subunit